MNDIVNKFLLTGDSFIPELQLRQPRFSYRLFTNLFTKIQINKRFKLYL